MIDAKMATKVIQDADKMATKVIQGANEPLREYVSRFGREVLDIRNLDVSTTTEAFVMGLKKNSLFYEDLIMNPKRLDDVRNIFIGLDKHKEIHKRINTPSLVNHPSKIWITKSRMRQKKLR